jgi:hypothetical protein
VAPSDLAGQHEWEAMMRKLLPAAILAVLAACSVTERAPESSLQANPVSGFLGDYSQLKPGTKDEALLIYIDPQVNWNQYTGIFVEPVTFISEAGEHVSPEEQKTLSSYYYNVLKEHLSKVLPIVERPGPNVIIIRAALTDVTSATPGLRTVSVVIPQARLLSAAKNLATDSYAFVGSAQSEVEASDATSGRRLAAAVDRRSGGLSVKNAGVWEWGDAEHAMDYWAQRAAERLAKLRSGAVS